MKLHLIKRQTIEDYSRTQQRSGIPFDRWLQLALNSDWEKPTDMQRTFNSADLLGKSSERVIFNIGGNHYRMICKYHFGKERVHLFIMWIGTHAEYDRLCKMGGQYSVSNY
jgi:mRNA interferase HigB